MKSPNQYFEKNAIYNQQCEICKLTPYCVYMCQSCNKKACNLKLDCAVAPIIVGEEVKAFMCLDCMIVANNGDTSVVDQIKQYFDSIDPKNQLDSTNSVLNVDCNVCLKTNIVAKICSNCEKYVCSECIKESKPIVCECDTKHNDVLFHNKSFIVCKNC